MNGEIVNEIKQMLEEQRAISLKTATRLHLQLTVQLYESFQEQNKKLDEHGVKIDEIKHEVDGLAEKLPVVDELKKTVEVVKENSIILWVKAHPKMSASIILGYLSLAAFVDVRAIIDWLKVILLKII